MFMKTEIRRSFIYSSEWGFISSELGLHLSAFVPIPSSLQFT